MRKIEKALLVFFNGKSNAGGAERMVLYLDEYLQSRGIATEIIDEAHLLNSVAGKLFSKIFKYRHFSKRRPIYMARFTSAYLWFRKNRKYLTISNGESTPFFPVDIVINQGCYHAMELDYGRKEPTLSRVAKLQKRGSEICGLMTTVTEKVKNDLLKYYQLDPKKIHLVANRVDVSFFPPKPRPPRDYKLLVYVGRLEPGKGLANLLRVANLIEHRSDWRLLIGSNNPNNADLFRDFRHTQIKVGLHLNNINDEAYSLADLVFFPSLSESFGMVTIEALAAGVPVVGTPVGILKQMGENGFPGAHLFGEMTDDAILPYFDGIVSNFNSHVNRNELHQMIDEQFGIASYRARLDEVIGKAYLGPHP